MIRDALPAVNGRVKKAVRFDLTRGMGVADPGERPARVACKAIAPTIGETRFLRSW